MGRRRRNGINEAFKEAEVLDSLAWIAKSFEARVKLAASFYLRDEDKVKKAYEPRKYEAPTGGTVKAYVKSLFTIPSGQHKATIAAILEEIPKQRAIRDRRRKFRPYKEKERKTRPRTERWDAIGHHLYTIVREDKQPDDHNIVGGTSFNGTLVVVDKGNHYAKPRIYMRQKATGKVKVVVLDVKHRPSSITNAMLAICPTKAYRGMFDGKPVVLDFDREGFLVEGVFHPWRNIRKVYRGVRAARNTLRDPKK